MGMCSPMFPWRSHQINLKIIVPTNRETGERGEQYGCNQSHVVLRVLEDKDWIDSLRFSWWKKFLIQVSWSSINGQDDTVIIIVMDFFWWSWWACLLVCLHKFDDGWSSTCVGWSLIYG
jgi:hypothetical protein